MDDRTVVELVEAYAGDEDPHAQQMFEDSLRAALSMDEISDIVSTLGFPTSTVQATSDRHWTWAATQN